MVLLLFIPRFLDANEKYLGFGNVFGNRLSRSENFLFKSKYRAPLIWIPGNSTLILAILLSKLTSRTTKLGAFKF